MPGTRVAFKSRRHSSRRRETASRAEPVDWDAIRCPTLVLVGDQDDLVGSPQPLAEKIAGARITVVSGDHLSAVADPAFTAAIIDFLS